MREMQSPEGGYYATLDADSEGEEGKFYVWDRSEVRELIGEEAWPVFAKLYGLDRDANFEGHWHLHQMTDLSDAAATDTGIPGSERSWYYEPTGFPADTKARETHIRYPVRRVKVTEEEELPCI